MQLQGEWIALGGLAVAFLAHVISVAYRHGRLVETVSRLSSNDTKDSLDELHDKVAELDKVLSRVAQQVAGVDTALRRVQDDCITSDRCAVMHSGLCKKLELLIQLMNAKNQQNEHLIQMLKGRGKVDEELG